MLSTTITISDVGITILWLAILVLIIFLTILIKRGIDILKNVSTLLEINEEKINETVTEVPGILQNVNDITGEVAHDIKAVRTTVDTITEKSSVAADSLENIDSVIAGVTTVIQSGMWLKDIYNKNIKLVNGKK